MSHFGGGPADIIVDPADGKPNTVAHITIYPKDPSKSASDPITALLGASGELLPGYVTPNGAGQVIFQTVDEYDSVYGQDPAENVYRYDSTESRDNASIINGEFPVTQQQASDAYALASTATTTVGAAAEIQRMAGQLSGVGCVDISKGVLTKGIQLHTSSVAVIQCPAWVPETNEWYVSHNTAGSTGDRETTVIDRISSTGALLDTMTVTDAGHGTFIDALYMDGAVWIWMPVKIFDASGNVVSTNIYRVRYEVGTFGPPAGDQFVSMLPSAVGVSTQTYMDAPANLCCISIQGVYKLYALDDVIANGLDAKQIGVTVHADPSNGAGIQGVCIFGDTLYRVTGDNTVDSPGGAPKILGMYSFQTGKLLSIRNYNAEVPAAEPEGCRVLRDAHGLPVLYLSNVEGPGGARASYLYSLPSTMSSALA